MEARMCFELTGAVYHQIQFRHQPRTASWKLYGGI